MGQPDVCGPAEAVADMRSRVQLTGSVVEAPLATPDARILHRRRRACAACLMAEERAHMLSVYSHSFFFFFFPLLLVLSPHPRPLLPTESKKKSTPRLLIVILCSHLFPLSSRRARASLSSPTIEAASSYEAAVRISMGSWCFLECG